MYDTKLIMQIRVLHDQFYVYILSYNGDTYGANLENLLLFFNYYYLISLIPLFAHEEL